MEPLQTKKTDAERIQSSWSQNSQHTPTKAEVKRAAQLAWDGHLISVEFMRIVYIDISDIPLAQMKKLTSIVTWNVGIDFMTPTSQLSSILACVKCPGLWLGDMELSEENTRALVTAMRERVVEVWLWDNITLDIEELTKYDGRGRCWRLEVGRDTRTRHGDRLRSWAADKGWRVTEDNLCWLVMVRK